MSTSTIGRSYGWRRQLPDKRDFTLDRLRGGSVVDRTLAWPAVGSLRADFPPCYDQLQLGSCTGNGIAGALEYQEEEQYEGARTPSRLFIYYGERVIEGTVPSDAGAEIRDGLKVVGSLGAPPETLWPYSDANPGPFQQQPSPAAYVAAAKRKAVRYYAINQDLWDLKWCINNHYPFVFGFTVYTSFESIGANGIMPMPNYSTEQVLGGHAVVGIGYDDSKQAVEVRNSWGPSWGDGGHFWMPYQYITDAQLCSDFWTIRRTS